LATSDLVSHRSLGAGFGGSTRESYLPLLDESAEVEKMPGIAERLAFEKFLTESPLYARAMRRAIFRYRRMPRSGFNSITGIVRIPMIVDSCSDR
jgi:hypothetical protein